MKFVNIHCHLLNFAFVPDDFLKTRASFISEWMVRNRIASSALFFAEKFIPVSGFKRLHEMVDMFMQGIDVCAEILLKEMDEANIEIACPLMMDMSKSSYGDVAEISYQYQIELISEIAKNSNGRLRPFVMLHPSRKNAFNLIRKALEEYNFHGVKVYTELGYHPDPDSLYNKGLDKSVANELRKTYEYCDAIGFPIAAHCSQGGAYSDRLKRSKDERLMLVHPKSWEPVLKRYPNLKVDLAHMGGMWWSVLKKMMLNNDFVYTDTAYCDHLFKDQSNILEIPKELQKRVMFGTDWPMTRHTWTEKEWTERFTNAVQVDWMDDLMRNNSISFLG